MNSSLKTQILVVKVSGPASEIDMLVDDAHIANQRANALAAELLLKGDSTWTVKTFVEDATFTAELRVDMRRINEPIRVDE